ncbi:MAG: MFS transporter, partial [Alcaligenaceae bacterium]|nr:MFS transporter [Alcaligenaceae bacterium]
MSNASRIFLFFSLGYFVSYLYRGVNIGFSTFLTSEIGLSAADLGVLTSLYFLGFAMTQIPVGAALDTWGPRRVNGVLILFAAAGSVIFGLSDSMWGLMLGRLVIGIGV